MFFGDLDIVVWLGENGGDLVASFFSLQFLQGHFDRDPVSGFVGVGGLELFNAGKRVRAFVLHLLDVVFVKAVSEMRETFDCFLDFEVNDFAQGGFFRILFQNDRGAEFGIFLVLYECNLLEDAAFGGTGEDGDGFSVYDLVGEGFVGCDFGSGLESFDVNGVVLAFGNDGVGGRLVEASRCHDVFGGENLVLDAKGDDDGFQVDACVDCLGWFSGYLVFISCLWRACEDMVFSDGVPNFDVEGGSNGIFEGVAFWLGNLADMQVSVVCLDGDLLEGAVCSDGGYFPGSRCYEGAADVGEFVHGLLDFGG